MGKTDLTQFLSLSDAQALIDETETIFNRFGMDGPVYPTDMDEAKAVRKQAKRFGIDLLLIKQKHLGSDRLPAYIAAMADHIQAAGVTVRTSEAVKDVIVEDDRVVGVLSDKGKYTCNHVILAPGRGRGGMGWGGWPRATASA